MADHDDDQLRRIIKRFIKKIGGRFFDSLDEYQKWQKEQCTKTPLSPADPTTQDSARAEDHFEEKA